MYISKELPVSDREFIKKHLPAAKLSGVEWDGTLVIDERKPPGERAVIIRDQPTVDMMELPPGSEVVMSSPPTGTVVSMTREVSIVYLLYIIYYTILIYTKTVFYLLLIIYFF